MHAGARTHTHTCVLSLSLSLSLSFFPLPLLLQTAKDYLRSYIQQFGRNSQCGGFLADCVCLVESEKARERKKKKKHFTYRHTRRQTNTLKNNQKQTKRGNDKLIHLHMGFCGFNKFVDYRPPTHPPPSLSPPLSLSLSTHLSSCWKPSCSLSSM